MKKKLIALIKDKERELYEINMEQRKERVILHLNEWDKLEIEVKAQLQVLIHLLKN